VINSTFGSYVVTISNMESTAIKEKCIKDIESIIPSDSSDNQRMYLEVGTLKKVH
jgi:hypothetical protein